MRLLLNVDVDDANLAEYLLVNLGSPSYLEKVRDRLLLYQYVVDNDGDLSCMVFADPSAPADFYGPLGAHLGIPAEYLKASRRLPGIDAHAGVREVPGLKMVSPVGLPMAEIQFLVGEEGIYWRAYHQGNGREVVSAPVPVEVVARLCRHKDLPR